MASFQGADVSNQTGIKVSANLANVWQDAVSPQSKVRMIKVSIVNEALEEDGIFQRSGSFDDDFKLVHDNMKENVPAYYAYRMDSKNAFASREWVFLCFVPDTAPVRQKMIYAATRATLTKELGDSHFTDNIYGTSMNDFTLEGYKRHRASLSAPKPLTDRERQLAEIRENEKVLIESMKGASQRKAHAPGMNFPLTDEAVEALKKLVISVAAPPEPATMIVKKKVIRRVTVPKKKTAKALSSPASTPLPASPVVSRTNTSTEEDAEKKKEDKEEKDEEETNVKEDEWDDDEEAEAKSPVKKEEEEKEAEEPKKTEEEDQATVSAVEEEEEEETEEIEVEEEVEEEVPAPVAEPKKVERTINFVKLAIDQQNERIELVGESMIQAKELVKNIDEDAPRFTFFAYEHTHQGKEHDSLGKSKIRERMLYSSCRAGVLEAAKSEAGLEVDKKLETTDVSDLTESFVREELHSHYETASSPSSLRSGSSSSNNSPRVGGMGFGGIPLPAATSTLGNGGRTFNKPVRPGARKVM
ncbi:Twinfilin-1 [Actinomortierella ambigua]|uniref:Twinfilin n=1 Tax=Actinomortierella ambigua TaxID=1343610 RepID=A0A9P6QB19_9FUNG|nr:Twinfilin-1 [Actinomortierella ambigua]